MRKPLERRHLRLQTAVAVAGLLGFGLFCALVVSKTFFLGSDSAHHYSHVWYISDQLFHHGRLPLHIEYLEGGDALTFPYGVVPYLGTAALYFFIGDRALTIAMVAGIVFYGYAATRARPALRDLRLLSLIYANTFLVESLVSFQFTFIWACGFFFLCVEAIDKRKWAMACLWAVVATTTHIVAGPIAVALYAAYALARRPRDFWPLAASMLAAALITLPFLWYTSTTPAVSTTPVSYIWGTVRYMARFRGVIIALPFIVSALAGVLRPLYLPAFALLAGVFFVRWQQKHVNIYGVLNESRPFYAEFIASPEFDRGFVYRVLEPNDREDGAYQLMRNRVELAQEFFDQSQFRRWWYTVDQYSCFLGAKGIDVVIYETDFKRKFNENEEWPLDELLKQGRVRVLYTDPQGRFIAYDVRDARTEGASIDECGF
jgi:hypothetical protein